MSTIIRIKPKVTINDLDVAVRMELDILIKTEKITVIFEQRYMETKPIYIRKKGENDIQKVSLIGIFSTVKQEDETIKEKEHLIVFAVRDKASYKVIFDVNEEYEIISEVCIDNTINVVEK